MAMNRDQIMQKLTQGTRTITYTDQEGQTQTRRGTLNEEQIPQAKRNSQGYQNNTGSQGSGGSQSQSGSEQQQSGGNQSQSNVTYYDLDKNDFRTFSMDRLQNIE